MDLEPAVLRSFVVVAEELHFGRAALRLGLSQPQVSRRVRALEEMLGVELFVRTARRTTLTDAGALLLVDARETLAAADRLQARAAVARRGVAGRVAVAFVWSTLSEYLPRLVGAAAERHRQIELSVSQLAYVEILPALRRGDVDLVITRRLWEQHEMVEVTLMHEPSVVAVPERHELARAASIPIARLDGEPLIALNRALAPRAYDAVLEAARARGLELRIVQHVRSATEALALVSAGIGVYRMQASATQPHPGVVFVQIEDAPSRVVLVRRPAPPAPPVAAIEELARSLFNDARGASNDASGRLEPGAASS